jgi:16S rRNA (cytidine1402-2'-O)-methyltransferase
VKGSHRGQRSKPRPGGKRPESDHDPQTVIGPDAAADSDSEISTDDSVPMTTVGRGCLALVATPIGNLGDITPRAIDWLRAADVIACEDSRVSGRLLQHYGIDKKLLAYHDHNADEVRPLLLRRLLQGERIALISDAGTPLISDPGYKLVRAAAEAGIKVTALPGPSAPVMALILSGLPTDRFMFAGFLPAKSAARRQVAAELLAVPASLIFFETAPRLAESLADLVAVLGNRPAAVARELTKLYEEVRRGPLEELAGHYRDKGPPRGEIVLVIAPPSSATAAVFDLDAALLTALEQMSVKDAAAKVAAVSGLQRRLVYARALELAQTPERASGKGNPDPA